MRETVLDPLGVRLTDVTLSALADSEIERIQGLLAEYGVVIVPEQQLDDDAFLTFLRRFGAPVFTAGETPLPGYPDLNVVTNVGRTTAPRSVFHVDTTYVSRPPAYTALRAVQVPHDGGETVFTNQYRAHDTLPDGLREQARGRLVRHVVTGVDPGSGQEHEADHPLLRKHPVSGRTSLYLSSPQRCVSVSGLGEAAGARLIAELYQHSTRPDNLLRHCWRPHDIVMWDNGCVLHKADHSGVVGDRTLHRGMVDGYAALA